MFECAIEAKALSSLKNLHWRLLLGPNLPDAVFQRLRSRQQTDLVVEGLRNDFRSLLKNCRLAITQAGYNTILDLLSCHCRAVLVPYQLERENEQLSRARRLSESGRFQVLYESELTSRNLARSIDTAAVMPLPNVAPMNLKGADKSADVIMDMLARKSKASNLKTGVNDDN